MKKLIVCLAVVASSQMSMAGTSFDSTTGNLVIPDVSVDGASFYDSVTLRLNLATGTFQIVAATPKNLKISDSPLQTFTSGDITVDFLGCFRSGTTQITCHTQVTNAGNDANVAFASKFFNYFGKQTDAKLYDNFGTPYTGTVTVFGKSSANNVEGLVLRGVPTRAVYTFSDVDARATSIAAFYPGYFHYPTQVVMPAKFNNISF